MNRIPVGGVFFETSLQECMQLKYFFTKRGGGIEWFATLKKKMFFPSDSLSFLSQRTRRRNQWQGRYFLIFILKQPSNLSV